MALAGPVLLVLAGPIWLVPILLGASMVSAATHLKPRTLGTLLVFTSTSYLVTSWAIEAELVRVAEAAEVGGRISLGWSVAVATVFLPVATLFSGARAWADERKRMALEQSLVDLRLTEESLRVSQQAAEQASARLTVEVERKTHELERRNRSLSIVNAVSFALSEPVEDDHAIRRAARLIARLLAVRSVEVREIATGAVAAESIVVGPDAEGDELPRLPSELVDEIARGGESIVHVSDPEQLAAVGVDESYVIVPMVTQGYVRGALSLIGDVTREWGDEERHLLTLIGRELGAATESARLYREALLKTEREHLVTSVSDEVASADELEQQLNRVLGLIGETLGPAAAAVVRLPMDAPSNRELACWLTEDTALALADESFDGVLETIARASAGMDEPKLIEAGESPLDQPEIAETGAVIVAPLRTRAVAEDADQSPDLETPARATQSTIGLLVVVAPAGWSWPAEDVALVARVGGIIARRLDAEQLVQLQQRRLEEMAGLAEIGRVVQSGSDTDRLYSAFAAALSRLVPYRQMLVARIENSSLVDLPLFGAGGKLRTEVAFSPDDVNHPWFVSRETVSWNGASDQMPSFMPRAASGLVIPMRPKGQPIGAVILELAGDEGESSIHLAERAVEQLSLALDSAELYQQATERASRIQAQSNLANIVASSVDLRETFDGFAEEVRWLIPFERAVMLMVDRQSGLATSYASYPPDESETEPALIEGSVVERILEAEGPIALRRSTSGNSVEDWTVFGRDVAELAAVAVRESRDSIAVFALLHSGRADYDSMDLHALEEVSGLLSVTIDRQILFERAEYAARHDHLTGLANYRFLQEYLTDLQKSFDDDHRTAVMVADMDGLKIYNDALGHEAGDRAIQRVAEELKNAVRAEDLVARTGGDEFVVVMEDVSEEDAALVSQRVHDALRDVHEEIDDAPVPVRVSIGLAMAPEDGTTPGELLEAADRAMYAAKFSGGDRTRAAAESGDKRETPRTIRRRGNRVMDLLIRSAVDGASGPERIALALAQRYAVAVAIGRGLPMDTTDSLRMLVAAEASHHVEAPVEYADQATALMLLDGLMVQWEEQVGEGRLPLDSLLPATVRLAWEQIPAPDGPGLSADEALQILREDPAYDLAPEVMELLSETARTAEFERRRQRPDAA